MVSGVVGRVVGVGGCTIRTTCQAMHICGNRIGDTSIIEYTQQRRTYACKRFASKTALQRSYENTIHLFITLN